MYHVLFGQGKRLFGKKGQDMKKRIFVLAALALLLAARAHAYNNGDFQIWNTDVEEFKINENSKIIFEEEFRWGENVSKFIYQHYDAGAGYDLAKWLNIGAGYRHIYELKKGKFKLENEPYLTATLLWELEGFQFDDRNRMEYRHFDHQDDSWRYRNKMTMKFPWKFTGMGIQPYLSEEIYIAFGGEPGELNQNRFSSGLAMNLTKNLKAEVYYMLQSAKSSDKWANANVLGTKLKMAF